MTPFFEEIYRSAQQHDGYWGDLVSVLWLFWWWFSGCSRTYEQPYGYLKSPGWPNVYPHNVDCTIILKAPQNSSISFFFNNLDLESHSQCQFDFLEVKHLLTYLYKISIFPISSHCIQMCKKITYMLYPVYVPVSHNNLFSHRSEMAVQQSLLWLVGSAATLCPIPSSQNPTSSTCASRVIFPWPLMASRPHGHPPLTVRTKTFLQMTLNHIGWNMMPW